MPSSGVQTCALDRKSTRLNSSHTLISYAVFCLKKENPDHRQQRTTALRLVAWSLRGGTGHISHRAGRRPLDFFFFNDTAPTEIYPLPLPDALPIGAPGSQDGACEIGRIAADAAHHSYPVPGRDRKSTRLNSSHTLISYAVFCL